MCNCRIAKEDKSYIERYQNWNITDVNIMTKAIIGYAGTKVGRKDCGSGNKKELKPWWKRRIKKTINRVRKYVIILQLRQR